MHNISRLLHDHRMTEAKALLTSTTVNYEL